MFSPIVLPRILLAAHKNHVLKEVRDALAVGQIVEGAHIDCN